MNNSCISSAPDPPNCPPSLCTPRGIIVDFAHTCCYLPLNANQKVARKIGEISDSGLFSASHEIGKTTGIIGLGAVRGVVSQTTC